MNKRSTFNKVFSKIWGASGATIKFMQIKFKIYLFYFKGGWLSASCPHKVVYAVKFVIRAEGPHSAGMKYQPNVVLIDMAHMVAAHGNLRRPGMFGPFKGRVAPATPENIKAAQEGCLKVDWPWLAVFSLEI